MGAFVETLGEKCVFVAPEDPKHELKLADPADAPLLQHLKKLRQEREIRLEKRRKKWESYDGYETYEQPKERVKKPKWRCSECGSSRHLEEDPDDRGVFYCLNCWEYWENQAA